MEATNIIIEALVAATSGVGAAGLFIWRASSTWAEFRTKITADISELRKNGEENKKEIDELAHETQEFAEGEGRQWQEINRSLGQIEGILGQNPRRTRP